MRSVVIASPVALFLVGCAASGLGGKATDGTDPPPVPEAVIALAAPWQNVASARLLPEDGCYWYEHVGQIETILLPLRTAEGRPICQAAAE